VPEPQSPHERLATPHTTIVTGAAGWLGRALVHRLLADPQRTALRVLVRDAAEAQIVHAAGKAASAVDDGNDVDVTDAGRVSVVVGDIADRAVVDRLFAADGYDAAGTDVVHTAGVIHPRRVQEFFDVNSTGAKNMVAAASAAGVRRFVHVSSNSPFGTNAHADDRFRADEPYQPYYGYGRSKMEAEIAVFDAVQHGLAATIVRPPWFYGPFQPPRQTTFFKMVRAGKFPLIAGGQQRRSMVYVDNLVDGILAAELTEASTGKGYWIADERPYTVTEIVDTVGRALRDEGLSVKDGAMRLPAIAGRLAELGDRLIQRTGRYQQQLHVLGEMDKTIACDISAARDELGYVPQVELYDGMRTSIRWCIENGLEL
jgi:nucleoside-diphosphate-sugar epimerase